jgi:hypothetical protein
MTSSTFKQILKFFLKFILILSLILVCDRGVGTILKFFYFRQESGVGYKTTYSVDSTMADILIFGSSRANHSYVPEIFEDNLHFTFYNTGRDGNYILYNYAIFKAIAGRYNPRLIIMDIRPDDIEYNATEYERLSLLLPYYKTHPEIRNIINYKGPLEKIKLISAVYPYNSLILQILMGNLNYNKERVSDNKGYVPILKVMEEEKIDTFQINVFTVDENKIHALKDMISTSKQKNIDLVFVYSPARSITQDSLYKIILSDLCSENGINYIDMSNHPEFISNHLYFADKDHLNNDGAKVFSTMLVNKLLHIN